MVRPAPRRLRVLLLLVTPVPFFAPIDHVYSIVPLLVAFVLIVRRITAGDSLRFATVTVVGVVLLPAVGMSMAESQEPTGRIDTFGDSLIWAGAEELRLSNLVDLDPVTHHGRILGAIVILSGVLLATIVFAGVTSWLVDERDKAADADDAQAMHRRVDQAVRTALAHALGPEAARRRHRGHVGPAPARPAGGLGRDRERDRVRRGQQVIAASVLEGAPASVPGMAIELGPLSDFPLDRATPVKVAGTTYVVVRDSGNPDAVCVVLDRCPHAGLSLTKGPRGGYADGVITCPWHNSRFDVCSGANLDWAPGVAGVSAPAWSRRILAMGRSPKPLTTIATTIRDGMVVVTGS